MRTLLPTDLYLFNHLSFDLVAEHWFSTSLCSGSPPLGCRVVIHIDLPPQYFQNAFALHVHFLNPYQYTSDLYVCSR